MLAVKDFIYSLFVFGTVSKQVYVDYVLVRQCCHLSFRCRNKQGRDRSLVLFVKRLLKRKSRSYELMD